MHCAEHLVAGERGFDSDFRGFRIANFTNHDDVRVLAEDGPERVGKGEPDFFLHGHLVDAGDLELYGIFDGDDVVGRMVQLVEGGIESGGLSGAGGACDENEAVRGIDRGAELLERIGVEAEFIDAGREIGLVQNAQHDLLAVDSGHDGHPEVVILACDADAHAAVLGQAAFGDVQAAHDFEPGGQGELHGFRGRGGIDKDAVNAVTQAKGLFERLDVDVAGAVLDSLDKNDVGQLDNGGFLAGSGQLVEIHFLDGFSGELDVVGLGLLGACAGFLDDILHAAALGGIDAVELIHDRLFRGDQGRDFQTRGALDVVNGENVQRVGHGQEKLVFQARDGDHFVIVGHVAGDKVADFRRDSEAREVDGGRVQDTAHGDGHVRLTDVSFFEQEFEEACAFLFLLLEQLFNLFLAEQAVLDEGVGNAFSKGFNGWHGDQRKVLRRFLTSSTGGTT